MVGTEQTPALGFLELSSISRGLFLTDIVLKKAPIQVIFSQPISSGKHVILYTGDVASVEEAHKEAKREEDGVLLREVLIPGVHPTLAPFLKDLAGFHQTKNDAIEPEMDSIGIVESSTLAGAILSADSALKAADVSLFRMRLGLGIGGKAYFVLGGLLEEIQAALEAAKQSLAALDSLCRVDCIARPDVQALGHF